MEILSSDELVFRIVSSDNWNPHLHMHNFCEIYLLIKGDVDFYIDNHKYHISPGTLLTVNDYEIHKSTLVSPGEYQRCFIHIPKRYFQRFSSNTTDISHCFYERSAHQRCFILTPTQNSFILNTIRKMLDLQLNTPFGFDLMIESCLIQILVMVNSLSLSSDQLNIYQEQQYSPAVTNAISFISDNLLADITLEQIASACSLEKHYLCRVFKKETGTTPFQLILLKRISLSKRLLSQGHTVTEACFQAGFQNYNNFITTFRKCTGRTPKQYQDSMRNV